jgi:hypothetical protein
MSEYEQAVFISYAWGEEREEIVNQIEKALQERGLRIIRDKRELAYKGSIQGFMERIGQGDCVIVVVSDKYLRSPNCMFELVEIAENREFVGRIFPVVLADANIYDPVTRIDYIEYWELKKKQLAKAIKRLDPANLQGIREEIDLYDRIRDKVSGLTSILKDMNTLTPEMHRESNFSQLYDAIEKRLTEGLEASPEKSATDERTREAATKSAENVIAKNGSVAIGGINIGGDVSGNIVIGNNNQVKNTTALARQPDLSPRPLTDEGRYILYTVKTSDTLNGIAMKHHTTLEEIMVLNPHILDGNKIVAGWVLKIPRA